MKDPECNYSHSKNEPRKSSPLMTSPPKSETVTNVTGSEASQLSETDGYMLKMLNALQTSNRDLELRTARIESRLVQLMIHLGLDPQEKRYG